MNEDIRVSCPRCGQTLTIESQYAGHKGRCPDCDEIFVIPNQSAILLDGVRTPQDETVQESTETDELDHSLQMMGESKELATNDSSKYLWWIIGFTMLLVLGGICFVYAALRNTGDSKVIQERFDEPDLVKGYDGANAANSYQEIKDESIQPPQTYSVGDITLQIPPPKGYSIAPAKLTTVHDKGKELAGGSGKNRFVLFARDGSVDATGTQGDTLSISVNDYSSLEIGLKEFNEIVDNTEREVRGGGIEGISASVSTFERGDHWYMISIPQSNNGVGSSGEFEIFSMCGMVLIDGHMYTYVASLFDASERTRKSVKLSLWNWLSQLSANCNEEFGEVEPVHNDTFYDLGSVGDVCAYGPSIEPRSSYQALDSEGWKVKSTLRHEKSGGIDLQFSYPSTMVCKDGRQPHVLFHISKVFHSSLTQAALSIGIFPYDERSMTTLRQLKPSDVQDPGFLNLVEAFAKGHGNLIGAGITTMEGRSVVWFTTELEKERLGRNVKLLSRDFIMPSTGGRCVLASYGITVADAKVWPYGDFKEFNNIGLGFINSITFMDKSQVGSALDIQGEASGTGWFLAPEYIVTCWHVLQGHSQYSFVKSNGERGRLVLVGKDEFSDIAILKVVDPNDACEFTLKLSEGKAEVAQKVYTVGYPMPDMMGKAPKYTEGVISALTGIGDDESSLQMTTPIQGGNSGGALLNSDGEVLGVVTGSLVTNQAQGTWDKIQNVNYAVKSFLVRRLADKLSVPIPSVHVTNDPFATVLNATVFIEVK